MDDKFGIYAVNQRLKVTNDVKAAGKVLIIPCSMGFKQQDGKWVNEWIDAVVFEGEHYETAQSVQKGNQITVNGRLTLKSWNDKKSWQILCEDLNVHGGAIQSYGQAAQGEDVPF
jgi:single-stranded DNA-binding protein